MTRRTVVLSSLAALGLLTLFAVILSAVPRLPRHEAAPAVDVAAAPAAAAPAADALEIVVGQRDKQFGEENATLPVGGRIKFVNDDSVAHNVLSTGPDGRTSNSGVQAPGESATLVFDVAGTYEVECGIHPQMRMTVEVK